MAKALPQCPEVKLLLIVDGGEEHAPFVNLDRATAEFPSTPMQDDIVALQYLYGPNYDHNSGNTVYTWSPGTGQASINGVGQTPTGLLGWFLRSSGHEY